mmetsp:Transcript_80366/g.157687  ORF Transcript_80366/g.157687 Transcript_80366/m.157687 type:complete len:583 (+) Transcript_80366:91-1839(+)
MLNTNSATSLDTMSADIADAKDTVVASANKANRMKGMKIRDEFICPITYELMRDPVVASDGHTYEKAAIEKWLKHHQISPRNGEPMVSFTLPNMNMKKLIQDIIDEGGAGFYTSDISNKDRMFEVRPEKILVLECLGPPESEWNLQSFQVNRFGCVGGRKHNPDDSLNNREAVLFKDITVSRRHFEITQQTDISTTESVFHIRDLGSAGGTFIRIPHTKRKQLHPGMIILLGKHQFTVSSVDDAPSNHGSFAQGGSGKHSNNNSHRKGSINSETILSLVENAERLISDFSHDQNPTASKDELSARLKNLTKELNSHLTVEDNDAKAAGGRNSSNHSGEDDVDEGGEGDGLNTPAERVQTADAKGEGKQSEDDRLSSTLNSAGAVPPHRLQQMRTALANSNTLHYDPELDGECADSKMSTPVPGGSEAKGGFQRYAQRRCTLTCCAPDGSPLQGQSFIIDKEGAMLGRKVSNTIPLLMKVQLPTGEERVINVDTAISSEHARVEFEPSTGQFFICDGTPSKPSTNGTWYRLSGPHQESPPHVLNAGVEVLIGTVRFVVRESMTISEHGLDSKGISTSFSAPAK